MRSSATSAREAGRVGLRVELAAAGRRGWWLSSPRGGCDPGRDRVSNLESSRTLDDDLFGVVLHGRAAEVAPTLDRIVSDLMA